MVRTIKIKELDRTELCDRNIIFQYESRGHYMVRIQPGEDGWNIDLTWEDFKEPFRKYNDRDMVIQPYKGNSEIYGAFIGKEEAGLIQIEYLPHNRSVRVWDLNVWPDFQQQGVGTALMEKCIIRAREMNANAIGFGSQTANVDSGSLKAVERTFSPEFRNRLDGIVQFNHLSSQVMEMIVDKNMAELKTMLK
jgi:GNAT superfamily N-acetyltransferase